MSQLERKDTPLLYLKIYKQIKYLYGIIHHFKKEYKYTLGQSILDTGWRLLDLVIRANALPNCQKSVVIAQASAYFDRLKTRERMAHELGLISHQKFAYIIEQNEEIGRMLGGWLSWAKSQKGV